MLSKCDSSQTGIIPVEVASSEQRRELLDPLPRQLETGIPARSSHEWFVMTAYGLLHQQVGRSVRRDI